MVAQQIAAAALADDEREFRRAMVDGLKELVVATQQMREQNAAYQAEARAHQVDTQRQIDELKARTEKQAEKVEAGQASALRRQIDMDWKLITIAVTTAAAVIQALGNHVTLHW